jgi:hypothetical protein
MKNLTPLSKFICESENNSSHKFIGYFITYLFYGNEGIANGCFTVVGNSFGSIAVQIFEFFGITEDNNIDVNSLNSVEDIMFAIEEYYENSSYNFNFFNYYWVEMTPREQKESLKYTENLLNTKEVLELGKKTFVDFDSKIKMIRKN